MHHDLPRPTRELDRLKADMDTWGYCLAADALEGGVLETVRERLLAMEALGELSDTIAAATGRAPETEGTSGRGR